MSLTDRKWHLPLLAALGLFLFLPRLGSFGFWDPYEIRIADAARALAQAPHWSVAPQLGKPPALVWLVAGGFKLLGVHELGGRLPIALASLLTLLATYYLGVALLRPRGALIGGFALATAPQFLLGARQLTSNAPLLLGAVLAVAGLARAAWPVAGTSGARRLVDLLLGCVGLFIGQLAGGALVGVMSPLAAVTLATALASGATGVVALGALATVGGLLAVVAAFFKAGYSPLLGGAPHKLQHTVVITQHLKQFGFGLFPWIALAPMAGIDALETPRSADADRARYGKLVLVCWFVVTYVAGTIQAAGVADLALPVAPAVLLLIGGYLDERLDEPQRFPFAGLTAGLGAIILGRDFFLFPESYVGVHILESIRWPGPLTAVPYVLLVFAAFFGSAVGYALGAPVAPAAASDERKRRARAFVFGGAAASALALALVTTNWIVPQVSKHLSARDLYGKTRQLDPNAPVGQYRFNASGSSYYTGHSPTNLATVKDVFTFLGRSERVFVMAGSDELPSIDQFARESKAQYYVVDDTNSRYLVLSNQLGPKEQDRNPLRRFISETPPKPMNVVEADFEGKVRLLGYDMPTELSRGQDFKIRLYFQVEQPVGGNYKVFIHFDGPGTRFNGDHVPLEGSFPTQHWVPGYYITDEHVMAPDRAMQPAGYYRIFMGFFSGDTRLKVVSGPQDGEQRVKLGSIMIK
jgi:4-amino-4-deoxy-L-arabinose transferase-like glycosyltransferase